MRGAVNHEYFQPSTSNAYRSFSQTCKLHFQPIVPKNVNIKQMLHCKRKCFYVILSSVYPFPHCIVGLTDGLRSHLHHPTVSFSQFMSNPTGLVSERFQAHFTRFLTRVLCLCFTVICGQLHYACHSAHVQCYFSMFNLPIQLFQN